VPQRTSRLLVALAFASALALSWTSHLFFRDNFSTHFPARSVSAAVLRSGEIPFWNFFVAGGQPLAGNPNNLTFYPTTLLDLVLPGHVAFNFHFYLHLILGFLALRAAALRMGAAPAPAAVAAGTYVLSGAAISTLCFYNLAPAFALIPAAVLCLDRLLESPTYKNALLLGAVCGLLGLAAEPVVVAGTALLLGSVAAGRLAGRQAVAIAAAALVALVVALPQLLAYAEIAGEVERGFSRYSAETVLNASLRPHRLVEIVGGPFLGLITDSGESAYRVARGEWPLFLPTVVIGPLALIGLWARGGAAARLKIAAGLLVLLALGSANPVARVIVSSFEGLRIARYPEKLVIPLTVAVALLIGLSDRRLSRVAAALSAAIIAAGAIFAAVTLGEEAAGTLVRLISGAAVVLATIALAASGRWRPAIALHFAVLAFWAVRATPIDWAIPHLDRPRLADFVAGRLHHASAPPAAGTIRQQYRARAAMLEPFSGTAHGVSYSTGRSPEGMYSWLSAVVNERLAAASPPVALRYLRMLDTGTIVVAAPRGDPSLEPLIAASPAGRTVFLYRLRDSQPFLHPIRRAMPASSISEAVSIVESADFDPLEQTIVPASAREIPAGDAIVGRLEARPQALSFLARAATPSAVVVNQSYFKGWRATAEGRELRTFPANIDRLGIVVPAGQNVVTVSFGRRRSLVAASWLLSLLILAAACVAAIRSSTSIALPAR
jgi:hypothetical protein